MKRASCLVIGIAGRIGSGKSEVAHLLETQLGFQYVRYSMVLAEWRDTDPIRKSDLQSVGWEVMSGAGQLELNRRLIRTIDLSRDCAVDGLRHPIDFESLCNQFSAQFRMIYVETPTDIRFERLRARYATRDEFLAADSHPVESNIDLLRPRATAVVSGTLSRERLSAYVAALVASFRTSPEGTRILNH